MKNDSKRRIELLDELRGFAIIAMIVHHTFLDIGTVLGVDWGFDIFQKLCAIQPLFWAIFIVISGICSTLSRNTIKRGCIVLGAGLIITLVTAVIIPKMNFTNCEIYFGILHCLGLCMIITGLLNKVIDKCNQKIGFLICFLLFLITYTLPEKSLLFGLIELPNTLYTNNITAPLGLTSGTFYSADYFPLIPWIFMFLMGTFIGTYAKENRFPEFTYKKHSKLFSFVGRNSLWFYLAHQPILYGILYIVMQILVVYYKSKI